MKIAVATLLFLSLTMQASAEAPSHAPGEHSPYAGRQRQELGALTDAQLDDLRVGRGMSFALPAELNGYPGPSHVLELAEGLELTPAQRRRTEALFAEMQAEAVRLGERLIDSERALEALFADGRAEPQSVMRATTEAARLRGELRATHLTYHLEMKQVLTAAQVARYSHLRGYGRDHDSRSGFTK
ncbi:Spy/CpxP family protein refolding chaperone [Halomonas heilongjiangensis]|uniref:Spy/CpxP family protein refolding chaperone n=1 Tax=Halomonas heilongjiangensis TaxID=1387883 RepID=UPI00197A8A22|nr:hypothetical protein [Halomonas heilongjiangensis]